MNSTAAARRAKCAALTLAFLLACLFAYLIGNDRMALFDRDEAWYSEVARNMAQAGHWAVPYWYNKPFQDKPPLAFWCMGISMSALGVTEFAARLPAVISSMLTLLVVWSAVKHFAGPRRALWTIAIMGTGVLFMALSKAAMVDMELLLFVTISQLCLAFLYAGRRNIWIPITLWISCALAVLTKGPVVFGTMAATMITLALLDVGKKFLSPRAWIASTKWWWATRPWMVLISLPLFLGPWLFLVNRRDPTFLPYMWHDKIWGPIFEKSLNSRQGLAFPGFYLLVIWPCFLPWSLFLPLAITQAWKNRRLPQIRFCLAATIGPLVLIELVKQKLPHYLLPLAPPMAFLIADALIRAMRNRIDDLKTSLAKFAIKAWMVCIIACALAPWILLLPKYRVPLPIPETALFTCVGAAFTILATHLFLKQKFRAAFATMSIGSLSILAITAGLLLPALSPLLASKNAATELWNSGYQPGQDVIMIGYSEPSMIYYLRGGGVVQNVNYLENTSPQDYPTWLVVSGVQLNLMTDTQRASFDRLGTYRSWNTGGTKGNGDIVVMKKRATP